MKHVGIVILFPLNEWLVVLAEEYHRRMYVRMGVHFCDHFWKLMY